MTSLHLLWRLVIWVTSHTLPTHRSLVDLTLAIIQHSRFRSAIGSYHRLFAIALVLFHVQPHYNTFLWISGARIWVNTIVTFEINLTQLLHEIVSINTCGYHHAHKLYRSVSLINMRYIVSIYLVYTDNRSWYIYYDRMHARLSDWLIRNYKSFIQKHQTLLVIGRCFVYWHALESTY